MKKYDYFVIEGEINCLQTREAVLNLLAPYQGSANMAAGVTGAVTGQYGMAANAAIVGSYEGEDVDRFACYIGKTLVEGVFSRVMFADGDYVKAVVEKQEDSPDVLYAHAVLRPHDGLLSMPYNTGRGIWAELKKNFRWVFLAGLPVLLILGAVTFFASLEFEFFLMFLIPAPVLYSLFALWSWFATNEGEVSTAIFEALQFPDPKSLDLTPSAICPREGYLHEYAIFRYRRVIKAEDDRHGSPEPEPLKRFDIALRERQPHLVKQKKSAKPAARKS